MPLCQTLCAAEKFRKRHVNQSAGNLKSPPATNGRHLEESHHWQLSKYFTFSKMYQEQVLIQLAPELCQYNKQALRIAGLTKKDAGKTVVALRTLATVVQNETKAGREVVKTCATLTNAVIGTLKVAAVKANAYNDKRKAVAIERKEKDEKLCAEGDPKALARKEKAANRAVL